MGAIQNSMNQMLGTAAAAATLGKHIMEQEDAKMIKLGEMSEQAARLDSDLREAKREDKALTEAGDQKGYNNPYMTDEQMRTLSKNPAYQEWAVAKEKVTNEIQIKEMNRDVISNMLNRVGKTPMQRLGEKLGIKDMTPDPKTTRSFMNEEYKRQPGGKK